MKIGIYTSNVDGPSTGPGIYRLNLVKALLDQHPPEDIYLIHFEESDDEIYDKGNEIQIPPPPLLSKAANTLGLDLDWGRMTNLTADRYLLNNYDLDIIHLQNIPYRRPFWLWKTDAKFISTIHFGIRRFLHPQHYDWFDRERVKFTYKKVSDRIDTFITVTEQSKRLHSKYLGIDPDKIHVTHNAPPDTFTPTRDREVLDKHDIHTPYIFHLSNKNYYKNPQGIVQGYQRAIKKYGISHDLVFGGGRWSEDDIEEYVDEPSLLDRIHFLGYIPREELPVIYTEADLFFLPSLSEAFPFVILEALSCGTPVVTIDGFGMEEITGDAGAYISDPLDVDDIANTLASALKDRDTMEKNSQKQAAKFSWDRTAGETLKVYRQALIR